MKGTKIIFNPLNGWYTVDNDIPVIISTNKGYIAFNTTCFDFNVDERDIKNTISALNMVVNISYSKDFKFKNIVMNDIRRFGNTSYTFYLLINVQSQVNNIDHTISIHKVFVDLITNECCVDDDSKCILHRLSDKRVEIILNKIGKENEYAFLENDILSNYYMIPTQYEGRMYLSSEAAYQSAKTLNPVLRDKFTELDSDSSRRFGREIQKTKDYRKDWFDAQDQIMKDVLRDKFTRNKECYEALKATKGKNLVENTTPWHDNVWGRCNCEKCKGIGVNHLGNFLTELRIELFGE